MTQPEAVSYFLTVPYRRSEVWGWHDWVLHSESHRLPSKCWPVLGSHPELRVLLQTHSVIGSILFLVVHLTEVFIFFLAIDFMLSSNPGCVAPP